MSDMLRLKATLLINPIDNLAIRGISTHRIPKQLSNPGVIITVNGSEQLGQAGLQQLPRQVILIGAHDHRVLSRDNVVADQQLFVELLSRTKASEFYRNVPMGIFSERTLRPDRWIIFLLAR